MRQIIYLLFLCLFLSTNVIAQVGINTDNSDPDASAMLDVKSTNKGMLVPRMTSSQRSMINNAAIGLLVFDTDTESFWFNDTNGWTELVSGATLADKDNDTKIQVEESTDEDAIRFDVEGRESMVLKRVSPVNRTQLSFPDNYWDIFIGEGVGESLAESSASTAVGYNAFRLNDFGISNAAFGALSLENNESGSRNTALGTESLRSSKGDRNTGVGNESLFRNTTGNDNVGIGNRVGFGNQQGSNNVLLGTAAGGNTSTHNKSNNVMIGHQSGLSTLGSGNLFLRYNAGKEETGSNKLYIENSNSSTPLLYGEFDTDLFRVNGTLNINNAFSFPTADGSNGQVLSTDGSGTATWITISNSAATSIFSRNAATNAVTPSSVAINFATDDFVFGSPQLDDGNNTDHDSRFFFDKSKGAFRAGIEEGDKWDDANRGIGSVAMGSGNTAAGENSVAMGYQSGAMSIGAVSLGYQNGALGDVTVAIGNRNIVDTDTAFAIGSYNYADKDYALAIGTENEAQEEASTAVGYANLATAIGASAFGEFNEANGESSLALGSGAIANGTTSVAIGSSNAEGTGSLAVGIGNTADGNFSQTLGSNLTASSAYETVFGYNNTTYTPASTSSPSLTDRLFVIGNGMGPITSQRSDALIILKNGATRINGPLTLGISGNDLTSYTLPNLRGSNGQVLQTNGSGIVSWVDMSANSTIIQDADNDTKIQVEESADEDMIRFDITGTEFMRLDSGRIEFLNTGNSVFIGENAGLNDDFVDNGNVAVGAFALEDNTNGFDNVAIGLSALKNNVLGTNNVAVGRGALVSNVNGFGNTVVGHLAGTYSTGSDNVYMGYEAGAGSDYMLNEVHSKNVMIGYRAGYQHSGNSNIFLGYQAGQNETESNKLYIENSNSDTPLIYGDFSSDSVSINGDLTISSDRLAFNNIYDNIFIGNGAGFNNVDDGNVNVDGIDNVFIGDSTGFNNTTGQYNVGLATKALYNNTKGTENIAIGPYSLLQNDTGTYNVAIGMHSLSFNKYGTGNTALGYRAGAVNENGLSNVFIGAVTGGAFNFSQTEDMSNNVMLGYAAGGNNYGSNNVFIGYTAGFYETGDNKLYIDNSSTATPLLYGEFDNDLIRVNGELNIKNEYSLPTADGNSGQVLTTDGAGNTSWSDAGGSIPVGTIWMYHGNIAPAGWLICDGSTFNAATYPALHTQLGGNTLPDFKARFPMGTGDNGNLGSPDAMLGNKGGNNSHQLDIDEMPPHTHSISYRVGSENGSSNNNYSDLTGTGSTSQTGSTGGNDVTDDATPFNITNPYYVVNFIIKAN